MTMPNSKIRAQANAIDEAYDVLQRLKLHHESQAKPHTEPCHKEYNADLARKANGALVLLRMEFGS